MEKKELYSLTEAELVNISDHINDVLLAHIEFSNDAIIKIGTGKQANLTPHHLCELGKWIDQMEDKGLFSAKELVKLKGAHYIFHDAFEKMSREGKINSHILAIIGEAKLTVTESLLNLARELLEAKFEIDSLTGLMNRSAFRNIANNKIESMKRNSDENAIIVLADIDHFKSINDNYGHNTGDKVLKNIAKILKDSIRKYDSAGRWGGEEWVLMINNIELEKAAEKVDEIREKIADEIFSTVEGVALNLTCSFGISELEDSLELAVGKADEALYKAKENGRDQIWIENGFDPLFRFEPK